ncbi:MAG: WG repeat-containing protein [Crocinitomicaceae bacterium]|nr:WG repeat-containing protein [Crocinitomicaceae bacterium]
MQQRHLHTLFILIVVFFSPIKSNACKIDRAFEALEIYDYFKAKKLFYKAYKRNKSAASFGLAKIYYRTDNPFHNLDSAKLYIQISEISINDINSKKIEKLNQLGFNLKEVKKLKQKVGLSFFEIAKKINTPESLNQFINEHPWSNYLDEAILKRDSIAFQIALKKDTSSEYQNYQIKYPKSTYNEKANELYYQRQYFEYTSDNKLNSYALFIKECPKSPYKIEAQNRLFEIITMDNKIESYENIINNYPTNVNVNQAWRKLYALFMVEFSEKRFEEFKLKYPNYPYIKSLEKDYQTSILKLFPFEKNNKWGFMNANGKIIINAIYEEVGFFKEGLAPVSLNEKYGFISKANKVIIPVNLDGVFDFNENRALIEKNEKMGLIDRIGSSILEPIYEDIGPISENKFYFLKDSLYGYMDKNGKVILQEKYNEAFSFKENKAHVFINGKEAIIDSLGNFYFPPIYNRVKEFTDSLFLVKEEDFWGIAKADSSIVLPCTFDNIGQLSNNLAHVVSNKKMGFINNIGKIIIPIKFDAPYNYQDICNFNLGFATVVRNGKYGMIDTTGKIKIKYSYKQLGKSSELIAFRKSNLWGYMRPNGKKILSSKYNYAESTTNNIAIVQKDTLMGMINHSAKYIIPMAYNNISTLNNSDNYLLQMGNLYGVSNKYGKLILPVEFDDIMPINSSYFKLRKNDKTIYFSLFDQKFIEIQN